MPSRERGAPRCAERKWHAPEPYALAGSQWRSFGRLWAGQPFPLRTPHPQVEEAQFSYGQLGFGLTTGTEPVALAGRTWTNLLPFCHWKMNFDATTFMPLLANLAGPCTVWIVTPLCR